MTTRIEKDFYFQAGVRFEGKFYMNVYDLTLSILVETDSIREQNIAIERIDYFFSNVLENSIFVLHSEKESIELYEKAGLHVCTTPEEPYDQIIALILLLKLNAIIEGKLYITDITMGSKLSEGIKFCVVPEIATNIFKGDFWYNKSNTSIRDSTNSNSKKDKVVNLFDVYDWNDIGLCWKEKAKT